MIRFSAWVFALRTWAPMMVRLYAAFWLQLDSASSAAVTVGILALRARGRAYQRAVYRILATIIGVVAWFVIAGLFPQTRDMFVIGFSGWLGLCVYVGGLLDGNRAYGAVLSAYTVANVAVPLAERSLLHVVSPAPSEKAGSAPEGRLPLGELPQYHSMRTPVGDQIASGNGARDEIAHHGRCLSSPESESKPGRRRPAGNLSTSDTRYAHLHHRRRNDRYAERCGHEIHDRRHVRYELADDRLEAGFSTGVDNCVVERRSGFPRERQKRIVLQ